MRCFAYVSLWSFSLICTLLSNSQENVYFHNLLFLSCTITCILFDGLEVQLLVSWVPVRRFASCVRFRFVSRLIYYMEFKPNHHIVVDLNQSQWGESWFLWYSHMFYLHNVLSETVVHPMSFMKCIEKYPSNSE